MRLKSYIDRFNALPLKIKLELIFYPIFILCVMPKSWMKSLWNSKILLKGKWNQYMGFDPYYSINNLFYRTQLINIEKYGRDGVSPLLGLGSYSLKNWFHLSLPASYIYANAGAVTMLFGTLTWVLSHLLWLDTGEPHWVLLITATLFVSSTSYAMAFARQNYQILGWLFLPIVLYAVNTDLIALATITYFSIGIFSITATVLAFPIIVSMIIINSSWEMLYVVIPTIILTLAKFSLLFEADGRKAIDSIAKLIGAKKTKSIYQREINNINIVSLYFTALYFMCAILFGILSTKISYILILGAALYLLNQRFIRIADDQSLIILNATIWTHEIIKAEKDLMLLILFWLAVSPVTIFLHIGRVNKVNNKLELMEYEPFDHKPLLDEIKKFLEPVIPGERIYFAFDDPKGKYKNIFDGYRVIYEAPLLVASDKGVHLFPDWWAVSETNYLGAPKCWGRGLSDVIKMCDTWDSNYAIIYQESGTEIEEKWLDDFILIGSFDWNDISTVKQKEQIWKSEVKIPKWFLLKKNMH